MFAAFLITLREGLEAVLVITIIAMFLAKMGQKQLFKPMWIGIAIASIFCVALGIFIHVAQRELPQSKQELLEGIVGYVAVGVLTWMIFYMRRTGHKIKGEVEAKLDSTLKQDSRRQGQVLILMAFFAVVREGIETVLFLFSAHDTSSVAGLTGAVLGLALAIIIGYSLYRGSRAINIARVFHWTSIFIIFFAAGLLASSTRKFAEAGVFSSFQSIAWDSSSIVSEDSIFGTLLSGLFGYMEAPAVAEVFMYFAYLIPVLVAYIATDPRRKSYRTQPTDQQELETVLGEQ